VLAGGSRAAAPARGWGPESRRLRELRGSRTEWPWRAQVDGASEQSPGRPELVGPGSWRGASQWVS
jgi:hypothetical protein